jgi:hypothetical protein
MAWMCSGQGYMLASSFVNLIVLSVGAFRFHSGDSMKFTAEMLSFLILGAPAIGGFFVVGKTLISYGSCTLV